MAPLHELAAEYEKAKADPAFRSELKFLLEEYAGRPTPLYRAERMTRAARRREDLPQARGPAPHRRAQDQQRARPGAAGAAHGQEADHRGDRRGPARRGHGDGRGAVRAGMRGLHGRGRHGAAGAERHAHAAARREGGAGDGGPEDAEGSGERGDARLGDECPLDPLYSRLGARLASVPDDGARFSPRDRRRGAAADSRARGASARRADRLRRRRQQRDRAFLSVHRGQAGAHDRRGGGRARHPGRASTRRGSRAGASACCRARGRLFCRTATGRS